MTPAILFAILVVGGCMVGIALLIIGLISHVKSMF